MRRHMSTIRAWSLPLFLLLLLLTGGGGAESRRVPTIDEVMGTPTLSGAQISPDGRWVAYLITEADFKADLFRSQVWLVETATGQRRQMTRGDRSASNIAWSPDSQWLTYTAPRGSGRPQILAIRPDGGESIVLTEAETGVGSYAWFPNGRTIAYTAVDGPASDLKSRREQLGEWEVVRREYAHTHLWTLDVAEALRAPSAGRRRTSGTDCSVGSFAPSPDGRHLAFSATRTPDLVEGHTADLYLLPLLDEGEAQVRRLVDLPGPDTNPRWSPDGSQLAFVSAMGKDRYYHANNRLAIIPVDGGKPRSITDTFDEQPQLMAWTTTGIYFGASQRTAAQLFRVDPATSRIEQVSRPADLIVTSGSLTPDGRQVAFVAPSPTTLPELYLSPTTDFVPRRLTSMTDHVQHFELATREVINWKSQDGTLIEGILLKPANFDPTRRYPLLCVIHGGPTGIDRPTLLDARYYPTDLWVARGALVLKVNYRGSAGYGEQFRQLNVGNLGVGDAWDVLSGVDALIERGWVDPVRVGSMGWSQGGYISAFLTTSSDRFAAISVGAGISNWATYYYNTDITPFTIQYLGASPSEDPAIYARTSPMNYLRQARTPTLIQHGEFDRRVPIANAYELRQGLEDRGVPVEMVVYKGFGHGITTPRAMRAVMIHNLTWFNHYLFGDSRPDLTRPPLPSPRETTATSPR